MCQPQPAGGRTDRVMAGMSGVEARTCPTPPDVWVWDRGRGVPAPRTVARPHDDSCAQTDTSLAQSLGPVAAHGVQGEILGATCRSGAGAGALPKPRYRESA